MNAATAALASDVEASFVAFGEAGSAVASSVAAILDTFAISESGPMAGTVLPCDRRSLRISRAQHGTEKAAEDTGGASLTIRAGRPQPLFVSNNSGVEHRDSRCVLPEETCSFALVRAFIGYELYNPKLAGLQSPGGMAFQHDPSTSLSANSVGGMHSTRRLLKGEGIDVSLPTQRDINLQLWID
eukprot:SAG31_NODE_17681_length_661_cov_1.469751_2_plen_184_part_01